MQLAPAESETGRATAGDDDFRLIDEALQGHPAAFGSLVRKYQDRLYNTVVHLGENPTDAQDVVQEAFIQAFLRLGQFRRSSRFFTWLYRIAFNMVIYNRRRSRPSLSIEEGRQTSGREPVDPQPGPATRCDQAERCRVVRAAIAGLNEPHRAVVVLRAIDGCAYQTIAGILNIPIGTVRSRLHRARLQLLEELEEEVVLEDT